MNPFEIATDEIFGNDDFAVQATLSGKDVRVLVSEISEDERVGLFGLDEGVNFFLRVRCKDLPAKPKKNDPVFYQSNEYRVEGVFLDSSALCYRINLRSVNTR